MTIAATINVGVSSHYRKASYNSEVVTQGMLISADNIETPSSPLTDIGQSRYHENNPY